METYAEMRRRQQEEFNKLPMGAAFSTEQFERQMREWGLDPKTDTDKVYSIGFGAFIQKKDAPLFHEVTDRHERELEDAIAADPDGNGFIYTMFRYELNNHEFGYTCDPTETFKELGYTEKDFEKDERLAVGFKKAKAEIFARDE